MVYPNDLIIRCRELLPDWPILHKKLEDGQTIQVSYILNTAVNEAQASINYATVQNMTFVQLQARLQLIGEAIQLREDFVKFFEQQSLQA